MLIYKIKSLVLKNIFTIATLGLVCTACGGNTQSISENSSNVTLRAPRAVVLAGIPADSLSLNLTVDNVSVDMQKVGTEEWRGSAFIPPGQPFSIEVTWSTQGIPLAFQNQSYTGIQSDVSISFADGNYKLIDTDNDTHTNIDEILGSSDVNDPNSVPSNNVQVSINTGLIGLWENRTTGIVGAATFLTYDAGEAYLFFDRITGPTINFSVFNKSETSNCMLLAGPIVLALTENNLYADALGDTILLELDAAQEVLRATFENNNEQQQYIVSTRTDGISVGDLQLCTTNEGDSADPRSESISELF